MRPSPKAIAMIKCFESCKLEAYPDPANPGGLPITIGWGHTGPSITLGKKIDQATADSLLATDATYAAFALSGLKLNQNQYDALVSLVFNIGAGAFKRSTLYRLLKTGNYVAASKEFPKWTHAGGQVNKGLLKRRLAEQTLFNTPEDVPHELP